MTTWSALLAYDDDGMFPDQNGPDGRSRTVTTPAGESVVVALLGEIALRRDGALAALPGARSRLLLAALALRPGRSRSAQALIDDVWGEQPPRAPMNALHTQVSRLRSALPDGALEIGPAGYRLILRADQVDLTLADDLMRTARRRQAEETTRRAWPRWRGPGRCGVASPVRICPQASWPTNCVPRPHNDSPTWRPSRSRPWCPVVT